MKNKEEEERRGNEKEFTRKKGKEIKREQERRGNSIGV